MVILGIYFSARTQFVEYLSIPKEAQWHVKIRCSSCNQKFPKEVTFSQFDNAELEKQHGTANFTIKCKHCERKGSIRVDKGSSYRAIPNEDGKVHDLIAYMECRGVQIEEISMGNMFTVKVKDSPASFEQADFTDMWCQYDEHTQNVALVEDQKIEIVRDK